MNPLPQELNPFFEKPTETKRKAWLVDILQSVVIAMFICIIVYLFIATPNQVTGPSMQTNFMNGDLVLTSKITQLLGNTPFGKSLGLDYQRGDVIVFQKPGNKDLIKRVIAMPGETVMVFQGDVFVNGKKISEEYLPTSLRTNYGSYAGDGQVITLRTDEYFVMGDNRPNSVDSRFSEYGPIKREWMKGRVLLRYWPLEKFGVINTGKIDFAS